MKSNPQSKEIYEILAMDISPSVIKEIALKKKILESNEQRLSDILRDLDKSASKDENKVLKDLKVSGKKEKSKGGNEGKNWDHYQSDRSDRTMIDKVIEIEIYGQKYKIRVKGEEDEKENKSNQCRVRYNG